MTQSLSKIGVQFIADMSDMVSKMSGMSAYTKKWAKETAAMTNIGGPSGAEQLARLNISKGMSEQGRQERLQKEAEAERKLSVQKLTDAKMVLRNIRQLENDNIQAREEAERKLAVSRVTASRLMINQIRAMEESAIAVRAESERKNAVRLQTSSRLIIRQIMQQQLAAIAAKDAADHASFLAAQTRSRLLINQIKQQQAAVLLAATTQSGITMNLIRRQQAAVSNANWVKDQNTSRMVKQQASITRQMQATAGGFGGVTGAATQASFAIEDFVQVLSMGGGLNMALMSASNNLTMMARAFLGTSASLTVGLGIPILLIGIGHLVSKLMEAKDKTDELQKGMERLRKTMAEEAHIQMRSETRNFESMLEEAKASADLRDKLKQINRDLAESEDKLGLAIRQGDRALEAQIAGYEEASRAIFNYYQSKIRFTKNEETIAKTQREMAVAFQIYRQAYEQLVNANITSTAQARNALSTFNFQISSIGGTEEVQKIVRDLLSGIEDGTLKEFTDIEEAMAEITKLTDQRVEAQKRMNELAEQERIDKEQNLKYTREEMLAQMRMNDVQKEMFGIQKEMEEFVGGDPNNPDWIDKAQAQKEFLMNKKAELEKQMLEETQAPPIAAKMEQNAFQAQTYAMQQVLEAQYKRPDPQKEKILQVISNIDRAIQRGGIVIDVVP